MVLGSALRSGEPSHAYLFHGPAGTGKRTAARALAAELLAEGDPDPEGVRHRAHNGSHPDLTWVRPTGAHVMRVSDIEHQVVLAATRTPFEAQRRVFVLEQADTMNDEAANRMLKTLEEPAAFVHLILLTDALGQMLETVISRCQLVRFDPLSPERIEELLVGEDVPPDRARASARLALGNLTRARHLASPEGRQLRGDVEGLVRGVLQGDERPAGGAEPWRALLVRAEERRSEAETEAARRAEERLELEPKGRERRAMERELEDAAKREGRRARTAVLDLGLELTGLTFRDLACAADQLPEVALGTDRLDELTALAQGRDARRLREAVERCEETRQSLELNVTEDLALSALTFRLEALVGSHG